MFKDRSIKIERLLKKDDDYESKVLKPNREDRGYKGYNKKDRYVNSSQSDKKFSASSSSQSSDLSSHKSKGGRSISSRRSRSN